MVGRLLDLQYPYRTINPTSYIMASKKGKAAGKVTGTYGRTFSCTMVAGSDAHQWSVDGEPVPANKVAEVIPAAAQHTIACKRIDVKQQRAAPAGRQRDDKGRFTCSIYPKYEGGADVTHWFNELGVEIQSRVGSQPTPQEKKQGIKCSPLKGKKSPKTSPKTSPKKSPSKAAKPAAPAKISPGRNLLNKIKGV